MCEGHLTDLLPWVSKQEFYLDSPAQAQLPPNQLLPKASFKNTDLWALSDTSTIPSGFWVIVQTLSWNLQSLHDSLCLVPQHLAHSTATSPLLRAGSSWKWLGVPLPHPKQPYSPTSCSWDSALLLRTLTQTQVAWDTSLSSQGSQKHVGTSCHPASDRSSCPFKAAALGTKPAEWVCVKGSLVGPGWRSQERGLLVTEVYPSWPQLVFTDGGDETVQENGSRGNPREQWYWKTKKKQPKP